MKDLGYTYDDQPIEAPKPNKKMKHYPSFYIDRKVPEDVASFNVGDEIIIKAKVKITSKELREFENRKKAEIRLDVLAMESMTKPKKKEQMDLEEEVTRQLKK